MKSSRSQILIVVSMIVAGFMVMAAVTALLSDFSKLQDVFRHLNILPLVLALATTGLAFGSSALSFYAIFKTTRYGVPLPRFLAVMFISETMNFLVSSAGMSSIAIRAFLLKQEKIPYSVTITLSLAQNMIFNLVLSCVCLGALAFLHGHPGFAGGPKQTAIAFFMAGLLAVILVFAAVFFNRDFRRWIAALFLGAVNGVYFLFIQKQRDPRKTAQVQDQMESTVTHLHQGWVRLIEVFFFIGMNWCLMGITFYFCFRAVGAAPPLGILVIGFTIFFLSSNVNPVPAGLGVSESVLAFTFKMLGVGFELTLVAALLFRLVYYLIPMLVSSVLYLDRVRSFWKDGDARAA